VIVAEQRYFYTSQVRVLLTAGVAPLQYVIDWPVKLYGWVENGLTSQDALLKENAQLKAEQILLKAQLQKFAMLSHENKQLRALLDTKPNIPGRVIAAQLLAVDSSPFKNQVFLDKGLQQDLYKGQPVIDAHGLVGQVIEVGPLTSRVLLITDHRSAVPVQINGSGLRAIAVGSGVGNYLQLSYVPKSAGVEVGDVLVTSGLDRRFPEGYPVGTITTIEYPPGEGFAKILVEPSAELYRNRIVLLIWPSTEDQLLNDYLVNSHDIGPLSP
ncbi:MAG: rod shape-determining protein MreC, partial [Legionellales bacterium]|nr:rod shape-determining protein MreC [Legionellales bacterium]